MVSEPRTEGGRRLRLRRDSPVIEIGYRRIISRPHPIRPAL